MKYLLPKPHLSWSQMQVWESNPERYKREYFEGGEKLDTKYLRFGKSFAESIENGTYKQILPDLIVYPEIEYKMEITVRDVPLLSYIDSYNPTDNVFIEVKTGKHPWDQAKVQKHGQLTFYATALKHLHGTMPEYCDLIWIETEERKDESSDFWVDDKRLSITGKTKTFRRNFDEREIDKMEDRIEKVAGEISEAYKLFIQTI